MHTELRVRNTVVMLGDFSRGSPPVPRMYTFRRRYECGFSACARESRPLVQPQKREGAGPDRHDDVKDPLRDASSIPTQVE